MKAFKAIIKAFKIKYKITPVKEVESPYNPEFVAKILQGDAAYKAGKGRTVTLEELKNKCK